MIVGIAAQPQHNVGHDHGGKAPDHIQIGNIVQQAALAADYKVDLCLEEYAEYADHKTGRHIGYALWSEFAIGYHAQCEYFVVQLEQIRQIGLRCAATEIGYKNEFQLSYTMLQTTLFFCN